MVHVFTLMPAAGGLERKEALARSDQHRSRWSVTVATEEEIEVFECDESQTLLDILAPLHRKRVIKGCKNGGCGICKVKIVSGQVKTGLMSRAHVSEEEQVSGYVLSCRTWVRSDLAVEIFSQAVKVPR